MTAPEPTVTPPGCWSRVSAGAKRLSGRPALFLDRDGVVVVEVGYLGDPAKVELVTGAGEAVAQARAAGLAVVLVTNQSGVGRGYYGWAEVEAVQAEIARRLAAEAPGAAFDAAFACGFDPSGEAGPEHPWRKPAPGMLLAARAALGIDLARSWIVGDRADDLAAGRAGGLAGGVLVATGHSSATEQAAARTLGAADFAVMLAADVGAATEQVLARAGADGPC